MGASAAAEVELRELLAVAQAAQGNRRFDALFDRLYRAYRQEVLSHARRRAPEQHAEDIAAEAWAAVPHALETFNGDAAFHTWLMRIVAYKAADLLRRIKDRRYERLSAICSALAGSAPTPSNAVATKERAQLLHRLIADLESDDADLVIRHYGDHVSAADIARERGIAPNTIAQRLVRLRKRLKEALNAAGVSRAS